MRAGYSGGTFTLWRQAISWSQNYSRLRTLPAARRREAHGHNLILLCLMLSSEWRHLQLELSCCLPLLQSISAGLPVRLAALLRLRSMFARYFKQGKLCWAISVLNIFWEFKAFLFFKQHKICLVAMQL